MHTISGLDRNMPVPLFWIIKLYKQMKESINIWHIKEYEGDGVSCPVIPANLPWYKKLFLTFFRFGVCPMCVTLSIAYSVKKRFRAIFKKSY